MCYCIHSQSPPISLHTKSPISSEFPTSIQKNTYCSSLSCNCIIHFVLFPLPYSLQPHCLTIYNTAKSLRSQTTFLCHPQYSNHSLTDSEDAGSKVISPSMVTHSVTHCFYQSWKTIRSGKQSEILLVRC